MKRDEFISKAVIKHGKRFDYSKVEYKNNKTKVCIICPEHGEFWQTPQEHLRGCGGCPECAKRLKTEKKFDTTETFINKAKKVHGDKYDYSKVNYKTTKEKVCIICPEHGEFWQTPNSHVQGKGCPKCNKSNKLTKEEFINKAKKVHGDNFDYSKVDYKNSFTKICIICPKHGEFWQFPQDHLKCSCGCRECDNERKRKVKYSTDEIIKRFKKIHGDFFDYSAFKYGGIYTKSFIICPNHGKFEITPHDHLKGHGCPMCNQSALEKEVKTALSNNNIFFEERKMFPWLKYKGRQHLDFYLPEYNIAIECQGIQHFKPAPFFTKRYDSAEIGFKEIVEKDNNKRKLCKENGIDILYFSHSNIFIENKSDIKDIFDNTNDIIENILKHEQTNS